jgi:hypothetical protein
MCACRTAIFGARWREELFSEVGYAQLNITQTRHPVLDTGLGFQWGVGRKSQAPHQVRGDELLERYLALADSAP